MESKDHIDLRLKGAIIGLLVGDALAYPYKDIEQDKLPLGTAIEMKAGQNLPGTYSHYGAKMLCVIANINDYGRIDLEDLMDKLDQFYLTGYMSASGECIELDMNTIKAIKDHKVGTPPDRCGPNDEASTTSDNLTMMLPLALKHANEDNLITMAHEMSQITHGHVRNQVCAALVCLLIRNIYLARSEKVFDCLEKEYREKELKDHLEELRRIRNWPQDNKPSGDGDVMNGFWTVWTAYSKAQGDYRKCTSQAIKFGNNTNINASVAGCLVGLRNGLHDIPQKWINLLRLNSEAMDSISIFVNRIVRGGFS